MGERLHHPALAGVDRLTVWEPGADEAGGPYLTVFAASMGGIDLETEAGARRVLDAMASPQVAEADR